MKKNITRIIMLFVFVGIIAGFTTGVSGTNAKTRRPTGGIDLPIKIYNKSDLIDTSTIKAYGKVLPDSYDARDHFVIPDVENQDIFGTCWAFSILANCQESLIRNGNAYMGSLSKWQLAFSSYNYHGDSLGLSREDSTTVKNYDSSMYDIGGNALITIHNLANNIGPVKEAKASYGDLLTTSQLELGDIGLAHNYIYDETDFILKDAEYLSMSTPNRVKEKIKKYGLGSVSIYMDEIYFGTDIQEEELSYNQSDNMNINHLVGLVGWDDDYAVENFPEANRPKKPGAWLIKNSWGTDIHDEGYFWLSYEEASIQNEYVYFYNIEDNQSGTYAYDETYAYDGGLYVDGVSGYEAASNVFTMQSSGILKAVSIETLERAEDYEISIYKNPETDVPDSGTKVGKTITGTVEDRGYQLIDFVENEGEYIPYNKGDRLAIVVKYLDVNGSYGVYPVEVAANYEELNETVSSDAGESHLYSSEEGWTDYGKNGTGNLRIKAFTTLEGSVNAQSFDIDRSSIDGDIIMTKGDSKQLNLTFTPSTATNNHVIWNTTNSKVAEVSGGEIFAKEGGETTISATYLGETKSINVVVNEIKIQEMNVPSELTVTLDQAVKVEYDCTPANTTDVVKLLITDEEGFTDESAIVIQGEDGIFVHGVSTTTNPIYIRYMVNDEEKAKTTLNVAPKKLPQLMLLSDMQSAHPYRSNGTSTWEYARPNVTGFYLTFDEKTMFEQDFDYLDIYDKEYNLLNSYTGSDLAGQRIKVESPSFQLVLRSDAMLNEYGFALTKIEEIPVVTTPDTPKTPQKPAIKKRTLSVSLDAPYLAVGLKKLVSCSEGNVTYSVNNTKYASIDQKGNVKALKAGAGKKVTIKAVSKDGSGSTGSYTFKIYKKAVSKVKILKKKVTVKAGKSLNIKKLYKLMPSSGCLKVVSYKVNKKDLATVSKKGKLLTKKAAKKKKIKIVVMSLDGSNKKGTITVSIK